METDLYSWDPPHEDAENYLIEFIDQMRYNINDEREGERREDSWESVATTFEDQSEEPITDDNYSENFLDEDDLYKMYKVGDLSEEAFEHIRDVRDSNKKVQLFYLDPVFYNRVSLDKRFSFASKTTWMRSEEELAAEETTYDNWTDDEILQLWRKLDVLEESLSYRNIDELLEVLDGLVSDYSEIIPVLDDFKEVEQWAKLLDIDTKMSTDEPSEEYPSREAVRAAVVSLINTVSIKLCEMIAKCPITLFEIEWRELERVIGTSMEGLGFDVTITPPSKDGGKDVIASCYLLGKKMTYFIEIKHWRSGKRPGAFHIFDFIEINAKENTAGGLFLSSSGYGDNVLSLLAELKKTNIRLGNERKIVSLCQRFTRRNEGIWYPKDEYAKLIYEDTLRCG